ncbi:hypothetical protein GALL_488490 [mine drainage metagenome]|uniref:Uncharacterized protein n=1 Tax=mine drainage metagenome TaxID=410659 RepID=A0A1J5PE88_9ZZZZ
MGLQGGDHLRGRQRAGSAEIGRAIDRNQRLRAGVVDHVADPHHVALDGNIGAKHGSRDGVLAGLRECRRASGGEQGGGKEKRAGGHHQLLQRNSAVVDCIIWSAAVITLAFIS